MYYKGNRKEKKNIWCELGYASDVPLVKISFLSNDISHYD